MVSGLVTSVLLGLDFWARFGGFTLDLNRMKLCTITLTTTVSLLHESSATVRAHERPRTPTGAVVMKMKHTVSVPPRNEAMINCVASGLVPSGTYLVEPLRPEEALVIPARCCITRSADGSVCVRVVNTADERETLRKEEFLDVLEPVISVSSTEGVPLATNGHEKPLCDVTLGDELTSQQKDDLMKILREFQAVFYMGGQLPLVRVGVEHAVWLNPRASPLASRSRRLSPEQRRK